MDKRPLVAAVDIGTSWTSWVLSFRPDGSSDQWQHPPQPTKLPTAVLITPDGKSLAAFGVEAEEEYARLAARDAHFQYFYFRVFKMALYRTTRLTKNAQLSDISGKSMPAMTVFSLLVGYIQQQLLNACEDRLRSANLQGSDIHWVLTVPAIWNDASKQFMREAAEMAGLSASKLSLVLDIEAALLGCGRLTSSCAIDTSNATEQSIALGSRYLVVEAGGGMVDLGAYKVLEGGRLQQLHVPCGGDWGGAAVDAALNEIIAELFSKNVYQDFQKRFPIDDIAFFKEFNIKMRAVTPCSHVKFTLHVPQKLKDIYEHTEKKKLRKSIIQSKYADKISFMDDHLEIDVALCKHLFDGTIDAVIDHMGSMLQDPDVKGTSAIVMTGGLSRSTMLQTAIKNTFPQMEMLTPSSSDDVILKGAVELGHSPLLVQQRKCNKTYGLAKTVPFDEKQHDKSNRVQSQGEDLCKDIFDRLVEAQQVLNVGESQGVRVLAPATAEVALYATSAAKPSPMYVTDTGCQIIGKLTIAAKKVKDGKHPGSLELYLAFGGTEIAVYAKDSGEDIDLKLNFLI